MSRKCGGIDGTALAMMVAVLSTITTLSIAVGVVMAVVVATIERERNRTGMGNETEITEEQRRCELLCGEGRGAHS